MFDPQAHQRRGMDLKDVIRGIDRAQKDAEQNLGVRSLLIMNFQRDASIETAELAFAEALNHRDKIVAIGLDNTEINNFPAKFADLFKRAKAEGFKLTSHCDLGQPNTIEHIRGCLEDLQVDRLDHGYHILEDERLVQLAMEKDLTFTACPTTDF
jgi:adenosine deaminase